MFPNHISDKGLVFRIYKELLKFNNKTTNNPLKNLAINLNSTSSKNIHRWQKSTWAQFSALLVIRETKNEITNIDSYILECLKWLTVSSVANI